ncbi:MAG: type II toxin-antitoxin system RelE/ParE family toxin [Candidatus Peregrinibacteria bacterium]|nr:type II toxin-antitoxin system RelE/ParE family toxin [Candidatus Peregrinibacteria bacterium]
MMKVRNIYYDEGFEKEFLNLPVHIQKKAVKAETLFKNNSFHPSLRVHKLKGKLFGAWSISVDMQYRIIFKPCDNGDILFASVGTHAIYED